MAKDIKLYKNGHEVIINESQLDNFLKLGWNKDKVKPILKPKYKPKEDKGE